MAWFDTYLLKSAQAAAPAPPPPLASLSPPPANVPAGPSPVSPGFHTPTGEGEALSREKVKMLLAKVTGMPVDQVNRNNGINDMRRRMDAAKVQDKASGGRGTPTRQHLEIDRT
jgi:hypothetical protein